MFTLCAGDIAFYSYLKRFLSTKKNTPPLIISVLNVILKFSKVPVDSRKKLLAEFNTTLELLIALNSEYHSSNLDIFALLAAINQDLTSGYGSCGGSLVTNENIQYLPSKQTVSNKKKQIEHSGSALAEYMLAESLYVSPTRNWPAHLASRNIYERSAQLGFAPAYARIADLYENPYRNEQPYYQYYYTALNQHYSGPLYSTRFGHAPSFNYTILSLIYGHFPLHDIKDNKAIHNEISRYLDHYHRNPTGLAEVSDLLSLANSPEDTGCKMTCVESADKIACIYAYGIGVPRNLPKAVQWFEKTTALGKDCTRNIMLCHRASLILQEDEQAIPVEQSLTYFLNLIKTNTLYAADPLSILTIGQIYMMLDDPASAAHYFSLYQTLPGAVQGEFNVERHLRNWALSAERLRATVPLLQYFPTEVLNLIARYDSPTFSPITYAKANFIAATKRNNAALTTPPSSSEVSESQSGSERDILIANLERKKLELEKKIKKLREEANTISLETAPSSSSSAESNEAKPKTLTI